MKFYKIHLLLKLTKDIKNIDKKYYSVLGVILSFINEDENIYENITISPLIQESEFEFHIKLSFFEEEVYKRFFSIMSNKINHILSIDGIPFEIQ